MNRPMTSGPMPFTSRQDLVVAMAADLVFYDAFRSETDAIRSLYGTRRYNMGYIMLCIDDARQLAFQTVVAREMSDG